MMAVDTLAPGVPKAVAETVSGVRAWGGPSRE
jgi:hypothetical protein